MKKTVGLAAIDPKVLRRLRRPWNVLITEKGLIFPKSFQDHKRNFLKAPEIKIKEKSVYLSEKGRAEVSHILDVLCDLPKIRDIHTRNEVYACFIKEYENMWSGATNSGLVDEIEDFLPKLLDVLKSRKRRKRLYARITGVRIEGLEYVAIGRVKLRPFNEQLESSFWTLRNKNSDDYYDNVVVPFIQKNFEKGLCLEGEYEADAEKSEELFDGDCKVAISVFRLIVCLLAYDKIHLVKAPIRLWADAAPRSRPMLSVDLSNNSITLGWGSNFNSDGPTLNPENLDVLRKSWFWDDLCKILVSESRSELEDVIVTGIKWTGDAQNDSDISSAFVKYWTCLEGAFTGDVTSIAENLARSIAVLLIFGGYHFYDVDEFDDLFANIKRLYTIRSDIVHRGRSKRLTGSRLADACKYAVLVTFALLGLRSQGYTSRREIQRQIARIYARTKHARLNEERED